MPGRCATVTNNLRNLGGVGGRGAVVVVVGRMRRFHRVDERPVLGQT
jgi:hypothetical protein